MTVDGVSVAHGNIALNFISINRLRHSEDFHGTRQICGNVLAFIVR
jgi:hypothetical protein